MGLVNKLVRKNIIKKALVYPRSYNLKVYALRCPHICRNIKGFIVSYGVKKETYRLQTHNATGLQMLKIILLSLYLFWLFCSQKRWCCNIRLFIPQKGTEHINCVVSLILSENLVWAKLVITDLINTYHTVDPFAHMRTSRTERKLNACMHLSRINRFYA